MLNLKTSKLIESLRHRYNMLEHEQWARTDVNIWSHFIQKQAYAVENGEITQLCLSHLEKDAIHHFPSEILSFSYLYFLQLEIADLADIPKSFESMIHLSVLILKFTIPMDNSFEIAFPPNIERIHLILPTKSEIPKSILKLEKLKELIIECEPAEIEIEDWSATMTQLDICGYIVEDWISDLKSLESIVLESGIIQLPDILWEFPNLKHLMINCIYLCSPQIFLHDLPVFEELCIYDAKEPLLKKIET